MSNSDQYDVNFFKPLSEHAKANTKLIIILASVWAVGVFGFQFLLMILNEPTPEKSYELYQSAYPQVLEEDATDETKRDFAKALLFVLGKNIAVKDADKEILKGALSWTILDLKVDSLKESFNLGSNEKTVQAASVTLGLSNEGFDKIMRDLLPSSLIKLDSYTFQEQWKSEIPRIMDLYLIHNRSVLTDLNFIGFPFHYWYTAQFLLILFVVLCVIYAVSIEKANKKFNFIEET